MSMNLFEGNNVSPYKPGSPDEIELREFDALLHQAFVSADLADTGLQSLKSESLLDRFLRRLRLVLINWSPVLHLLTLLAVISTAGILLRSRAVSNAPQEERASVPLVQVNATESMARELDDERKLEPPAWPWNTCGESPERINYWLGQGPVRDEIDRLSVLIDQAAEKEVIRSSAAQELCGSLVRGARYVRRQMREDVSKLSVTRGNSRRTKKR
jgi:hypothetical protein